MADEPYLNWLSLHFCFGLGKSTFLTGGNPVSRRSHLPGKILLHRRHTGVNQQQALVSIWHQGKAGQPKMAL